MPAEPVVSKDDIAEVMDESFERVEPVVNRLQEHLVKDFFGSTITFYGHYLRKGVRVETELYEEFVRYQREFSSLNYHYNRFLVRLRNEMMKYREGVEV